MKNVSDISCKENEKAHFMSVTFFPENLALYELILKKYGARQATDDSTMRRMRIACWIAKVPAHTL